MELVVVYAWRERDMGGGQEEGPITWAWCPRSEECFVADLNTESASEGAADAGGGV